MAQAHPSSQNQIDLNRILQRHMQAKAKLVSMSIEDLLKLRDEIGRVLRKKTEELKQQLAVLGQRVQRGSRKDRVGAMKGRKVAPKYRNPKDPSETWAGRGAMPRWMAAEVKKGKKREHFAINKFAGKAKRKAGKTSGRKPKARSSARRA